MSDFTKGLPCPNCDRTARFQGGHIGGGINTTNIRCECGFTAFVVLTRDDYEYSVSAEPTDRKKANPYKDDDIDKLVVEKHHLNKALDKTSNRAVRSSISKAILFIEDRLKEE